ALKQIYQKSLFFRTLIDNSEMTLFKTFLPLTAHIENHPVYGPIRKKIADEYHLTTTNLLLLGNHKELMEAYPVDRLSVQMRERIVLPLVTIQQYALSKLRDITEPTDPNIQASYEKIVVRCAFGIINAGRNSA
nr:phosphoenolpyruvate carboxylase [Saprospiraceae bacterium]